VDRLAKRELSLSGIRVKPLEILKKSHSCQAKVFAFHNSFGFFFAGFGRMSGETTLSKSKREPEKAERKFRESVRDASFGSRGPMSTYMLTPHCSRVFFVSGVMRDFDGGVG